MIINVTSSATIRPFPLVAVYTASKTAIDGFTASLALELAEHGIRTNAVTPDWIRTPGNSGILSGPVPGELPPRPEAVDRHLAAYVPLGREGIDHECGEVIAFLCSPESSYVNGVTVPVDGGTWASSGWTRTAEGTWSLFGTDPMY